VRTQFIRMPWFATRREIARGRTHINHESHLVSAFIPIGVESESPITSYGWVRQRRMQARFSRARG
jgi:hypothetical protein